MTQEVFFPDADELESYLDSLAEWQVDLEQVEIYFY
jgi:hypothetical protein